MNESVLNNLPGGQALIEWFGRVPRFHDAELQEIRLASNGPSTLRIRTWRMTNQVDDRGYFVLDKHAMVTITLERVSSVALDHFDLPGIIGDLEITSVENGFQLSWDGSYGVEGRLRAEQLRIDFTPGGQDKRPSD
jgi:hypothetical protein